LVRRQIETKDIKLLVKAYRKDTQGYNSVQQKPFNR